MGGEATQNKIPLDDGEMPPFPTQPPSQYPPPVDALYTPYSPPPRSQKYASNAACLARNSDLPGDFLTAADDMIFVVYQDWVHQNPGTPLYGGIEEGGKWQKIW